MVYFMQKKEEIKYIKPPSKIIINKKYENYKIWT